MLSLYISWPSMAIMHQIEMEHCMDAVMNKLLLGMAALAVGALVLRIAADLLLDSIFPRRRF